MREVKDLLASSRLVTLTGCGGCGKTRLASETAAKLAPQFPDGVWFIDLAPVGESGLVLHTITQVLNLRDSDTEAPIDRLAAGEVERPWEDRPGDPAAAREAPAAARQAVGAADRPAVGAADREGRRLEDPVAGRAPSRAPHAAFTRSAMTMKRGAVSA